MAWTTTAGRLVIATNLGLFQQFRYLTRTSSAHLAGPYGTVSSLHHLLNAGKCGTHARAIWYAILRSTFECAAQPWHLAPHLTVYMIHKRFAAQWVELTKTKGMSELIIIIHTPINFHERHRWIPNIWR